MARKPDPFDTTPGRRYHRPRAYRYRVADDVTGTYAMWNRSLGIRIGIAVVIGHYAYCLKWADSIPKPKVGLL